MPSKYNIKKRVVFRENLDPKMVQIAQMYIKKITEHYVDKYEDSFMGRLNACSYNGKGTVVFSFTFRGINDFTINRILYDIINDKVSILLSERDAGDMPLTEKCAKLVHYLVKNTNPKSKYADLSVY